MKTDKTGMPGVLERGDAIWLGLIYLQWLAYYVYYTLVPTTYAPDTQYHALLNTCIVVAYHVVIFSVVAVFTGKAKRNHIFWYGFLGFLLYELSAFKWIVFAFEYAAKGTLDLQFAQLRFIDKQNIFAGYMCMLAVAGTYLCFKYRVNVARKIGTMIAFAFVLVLSIYHITLYFHEFEPMADYLEEVREDYLRPMSFTRNLEEDCKVLPGLQCYRFMEGEEWPEGAYLAGEKYLHDKIEDYKNGWPALVNEIEIRSGDRFENTDDIIWTETQRTANFDDTFVDQFDALIVFSKYNKEITVMIYPKIITRVLDVSERGAGAVLVFCIFWMSIGLLVIWSHPDREKGDVKSRGAFVFWNIAGIIAFTYYFNLFFHAGLIMIALLMMIYRKWLWLVFMIGSYTLFALQVWIFLGLKENALGETPLAIFAVIIGSIIGLISIKLGAPARNILAKVLWVIACIAAMALPLVMKNQLIEPFGWTPALFFVLAGLCLWKAKKEPVRLFSGYYLVMAGTISSAMYLWLLTGLMQDSIRYGQEILWVNSVNNVIVVAYSVLFYFSFLVGGSVLYLSYKHKNVLKRLGERIARKNKKPS